MNKLREEVTQADAMKKKKELETGPRAAFGYGGKFGVESDRYASLYVFPSITYLFDTSLMQFCL